jgi:hypothetical protein
MTFDEFRLVVQPDIYNPNAWSLSVQKCPLSRLHGPRGPLVPSVTQGHLQSLRNSSRALIEFCISNKNLHHGGEGRPEARMHERNFAWDRRMRRVLACKLRRMSRVLRGRLFAVWPLKSFQSCSTGLSSGA